MSKPLMRVRSKLLTGIPLHLRRRWTSTKPWSRISDCWMICVSWKISRWYRISWANSSRRASFCRLKMTMIKKRNHPRTKLMSCHSHLRVMHQQRAKSRVHPRLDWCSLRGTLINFWVKLLATIRQIKPSPFLTRTRSDLSTTNAFARKFGSVQTFFASWNSV